MRRGLWAAWIVIAAGVAAQPRGPDSDAAEERAFQQAVERVMPSVVRIETFGGAEEGASASRATTGLIVSPEGLIVSSLFGLSSRPTAMAAILPDGSRLAARLVATDHSRKLVLLKIETTNPLIAASAVPKGEIRVGQWAVAVGRVFDAKSPNVSVGIVSALDRIAGKAVQSDAKISPNNYGGPLVDVEGRVIGVLVPLSPESNTVEAGADWYDSGVGFAIPLADILFALPKLSSGQDLRPGLMGISPQGRDPYEKVVVGMSRPGSPAYDAGLRAGDTLISIDGLTVAHWVGLRRIVGPRYAGEQIKVVAERDGKPLEMQFPLAGSLPPYERPFLGILPARDGDSTEKGIAVRYVLPDSPAAHALNAGDRIISLDGKPLEDDDGLREALAIRGVGEAVKITVVRQGQEVTLDVKLAAWSGEAPAELPPSRGKTEEGDGPAPAVGIVDEQNPLIRDQKAVLYIPQDFKRGEQPGMIIHFHSPGRFSREALVAAWKPICDERRLVLVAPILADENRWSPRDAAWVVRLSQGVARRYGVDSHRVAAQGIEAGGTMAYLFGFAFREMVRGVCVADGVIPTDAAIPEADPANPLAFHVTIPTASRQALRIQEDIRRLRELKLPVRTMENVGADGARESLGEVGRWIDGLDRI